MPTMPRFVIAVGVARLLAATRYGSSSSSTAGSEIRAASGTYTVRGASRPSFGLGGYFEPGDAEAGARRFLDAHRDLAGIDASLELGKPSMRTGLGGTYLRFPQQVAGLPVRGGLVSVLVRS